ncbi:MAG: flagellar protein FlaG [Clostridiaceae bacterium]|jgi:flagellar protein FlaG|nr:flagellar protein FlaG [Clostridiaceae bacterium]
MEGSSMRIESTDANRKLVEYVAERNFAAVTSQKINTIPHEKKGFKEENTLVAASEKIIKESIGKANKAMTIANRSLQFSVHEATNEIMVKVINTETKEVIREIPPEKILNIVAGLMELAGLLIDERR